GFCRTPVIKVDLIFIDQGLTFPKVEALHQRTARVEHVPQWIGRPFPGVFDDHLVISVGVYAGYAHQLPFGQRSLIREGAIGFFRFLETWQTAYQALSCGCERDLFAAPRRLGQFDNPRFFQQSIVRIPWFIVGTGFYETGAEVDDGRTWSLKRRCYYPA